MRRGSCSRALLPLLLLGACGRAPEPASTPMLEAAPPPSPAAAAPVETQALADLDALEHELSVSEQRLNRYLSTREQDSAIALRDDEARDPRKGAEKPKSSAASRGSGDSRTPPSAAPSPARKRAEERPANAAEGAPAETSAPETEAAPGGDACHLACRAFGSMQRSAERICAIAGENDERCRRARARVSDASARISGAQCACQTDE